VINFKNLLPIAADNNYRGHPFALWAFILFVALMTWRSIIHMFFEKVGVHDIANFIILTGDPDPMPIIYLFFSLWGFAQLIFCLFCWIVIARYKSLIPLMYLFWVFEWTVREFFYGLIKGTIAEVGKYTNDIAPGAEYAPYVIIFLVAMFFMSILERKQSSNA